MTIKRRTPTKYQVRYVNGPIVINYVDRTAAELRPELERVQKAVLSGVRILAGILRLRNALIIEAYVQLKQTVRELPPEASHAELGAEIARLSYVMGTLVESLGRLKNSRIHNLQEARFTLTYGQTPKKREPMIGRPRASIDQDDEQPPSEEGEYVDED